VGGTGEELYPAAREAFEKLPTRDQVRFVPFGSRTDRYYPAFTVFTLCSESEAFPNVVLEAMASGVPCATTNAGDCEIMLKDLGLVVPVHDRAALAAAWGRLLTLPPCEREALAVRSRERAIHEYSMDRAARRFEEVYDLLSP
jgi:glycosyltransferase involved in cell wall biosynthesis